MIRLLGRLGLLIFACSTTLTAIGGCGGGGGGGATGPGVIGVWSGTYTEEGTIGQMDEVMVLFPGSRALVYQDDSPGLGTWFRSDSTVAVLVNFGADGYTSSGTLSGDALAGTWAYVADLSTPVGEFDLDRANGPGEGIWEVSKAGTSPWFYLVCLPGGTAVYVTAEFDNYIPGTWSLTGAMNDVLVASFTVIDVVGVLSASDELSGTVTLPPDADPFTARRLH
jgi:hypothetical protein